MRAARVDDAVAPGLLYESAAPYYDVYAGGEHRARRMLAGLWRRRAHTASHEVCRVAVVDGEVVGVIAAFPARDGERLARRFLALSMVRMPAWRWPIVLRHLRASAVVTPLPPPDALYVDALATAAGARRRGVATALLEEAERWAAERSLSGVALDTGLANEGAQALYEGAGFERREVREAPDERVARAVGGPGFISYVRYSAPFQPRE